MFITGLSHRLTLTSVNSSQEICDHLSMEHNTYEASCSWDMRDKCTEDIGPLVSRETQTQNMRVQKDPGVYESSMKWLESSSLENCGLTLSHLLSLCTTTHMPDGGYQMHISTESLADFEEQLYMAIEMYHDQIKCLTQGSKKVFGVVNGSRLGILVDTSDLNCSEERLPDLQQHLLMLIEEQLHLKKQLHLLSYSTEISSLWNKPVETCPPRLRESRAWVLQLQAGGGCDLLQAVQKVLIHSQLDTLLIILATRPDQTVDMICDYIAQSRMPSVHAVAYNCSSPDAIETVKRMAAVTGGKYHLFSAALGVIDSSTDVEMLWTEIKTARDILTHIHSMRQGRFQGIPVTVQSEIFMSLNSLTLSESSPVPCSVSALLYIQLTDPKAISSREWLNINGLKAQKLDLYQLLASNAYSPQRTFVPILGKTVSSTVHERVMVQFEWWDGTVKNLHVDLPSLQKYQTKLSTAVRLFEKRVYYLNRTGSLQIWGTVCEQRVQVLLDMSGLSVHYQLHIQHALRLLLQEQLANKHSFNVTVFGSDVKSWQEKMVPTTHENLQAVWQWIQGMECAGGRNTQTALRHVLREEPYGEFTMTQGVYLLTTGMPDQDMVAITAYVSEHCRTANFNLHVCLFTGEEKTLCCPPSSYSTQTDTARALRDLAHAGNGRFLWLTETGIVESDDIQVLIEEMEMAANYCQKCSELVDCLMQKSSRRGSGKSRFQETSTLSIKPKISTRSAKLSPPRPTKLSVARLENRQKIRSAQNRLTWRPSSSKADIPAGVVFKKYPKPKSVRRSIAAIKLPKHEELCSTKQWLKRFGFKNLKLDLEKMLSRPECSHPDNLVPSVQKRVSAKYCAIFPSVQINGIVKHLHLTPAELKQYLSETEKLMQRYTQRMKWLLTGSRCMFGAVLEKTVCVLLDVSGSMASFLPELQKGLALLIWDQLHANSVRFNMLVFSGEVRLWQSGLVQSTTDLCKDAVQWLNQLSTHGGSCTLQALQTGCGFEDPVALYLISDGRSDSSHSLILREIDTMRQEKSLTIHTIAVNSHDRACCEFLKCLAHRTAGRFHQAPDNTDADILKHLSALHSKDSVLPKCEGDDLRRLAVEIEKLTFFQKQAKTFRETIVACRNLEDS
ncbi:von Willebrand factor A domain-containing protein 3A isoform X4 [Triplophysa dalaica]|uniref:von Willebrand factor A domain-containing protein 3A isoform X4 n=1 Tax=Triplophysa dalaica TaxID=1582913 RepID=UPI0024E02A83|nr:von Willebrand factor A domain-containing protein 3A isoform X4 [Triplophysa dalaica]